MTVVTSVASISGEPELERAAHHPVCPTGAPHRERRQPEVGAARINEVVAAASEIERAVFASPCGQRSPRLGEVQRRAHIAVPALADRQITALRQPLHRGEEVVQEDYVCVDVAEHVARSAARRLAKGPVPAAACRTRWWPSQPTCVAPCSAATSATPGSSPMYRTSTSGPRLRQLAIALR